MPINFDFPVYAALVAAIESGAYKYGVGYECTNKTSTAYGRYQIINAVFEQYLGKIDHSPIAQELAFYRLTMDNATYLENHGKEPSFVNLYACHNQGQTGGYRRLTLPCYKDYLQSIRNKLLNAKKGLGL